MHLTIAPDVANIVRPAWGLVEHVAVRDRDARQDSRCAAPPRRAVGSPNPRTSRPPFARYASGSASTPRDSSVVRGAAASRAEGRRAAQNQQPHVDIINWTSLESRLPFGPTTPITCEAP
jgi:hypothetical protein